MMDQYPYTATSTSLRVLIPAWAMAGDNVEFTDMDPAPVEILR